MLSSTSEFRFHSSRLLNESSVQKAPPSGHKAMRDLLKPADSDSAASRLPNTSFSITQVYLLSFGELSDTKLDRGTPSLHIASIQYPNANESLERNLPETVCPVPFSRFLPDHSTADNTSRHSPPGSCRCPRV